MKQTLAPGTQADPDDVISAPPLDEVRWGFIGVGGRGHGHLNTMLSLNQARVTAIADAHDPAVERAVETVRAKTGATPQAFGADGDQSGWRKLLDSPDVDAVVIASPWGMHAPMGVAAMRAGKHAFLEVPAAVKLEECWELVETAEATGLHCMMLENCNYGREELMLLNMVRQGLLGELLHGEAAYIHELRSQMLGGDHEIGVWRTLHLAHAQGNLYPTHGVGPIAHCMDVNRGDNFHSIVSMSSPARGRALYAREHFGPEHKWNQIGEWRCGDMNTSIIKLMSGRTIMVQWDETTPRPYSRHNYLQGTRGAYASFPARIALDYPLDDLPEAVRAGVPQHDGRTNYHEWDTNMEPWFKAFDHPLWKKIGEDAELHGGHGGMDYIMFWRLQQRLLAGLPMDQSVYDAALWSSITPLSELSVDRGGAPQQFPDFTRGKWKTTPPVTLDL